MKSSFLASVCLTALLQSPVLSQSCASLHMIVARASTEPPGYGLTITVVQDIRKQINGTSSAPVVYPATESNYESSEGKGTAGMTKLIEEYYNQCPNGLVALLGYSQGAQVVGDTICGTSESTFTKTAPLAAKYMKNIVAAVQFGDPSYVPGLPWDVGTSTTSGIFPRQDTNACKPYASIIHSYCDKGDIFCASGNNIGVHYGYINKYQDAATKFVVQQYQAAVKAGGSGSSSSGSGSSKTSGSGTTSAASQAATSSPSSGATTTMGSGSGSGSGSATTAASASTSSAGSIRPWSQPGAESWILAGLFAIFM